MFALAAPQTRCFQRRAMAHREVPTVRAKVLCQAQRAPKAVQEKLTPKDQVARSLAVLAATGALLVAYPALADFCSTARAMAHREVPTVRAKVLCQAQRAPKAVQEKLTPKEQVARSLAVLAATGTLLVAYPALADFCSQARSNCMASCNGAVAGFSCNVSQQTYTCKCQ
ncbi:hypothetical protein N2152v2_008614 [Parachlorella kessleri]